MQEAGQSETHKPSLPYHFETKQCQPGRREQHHLAHCHATPTPRGVGSTLPSKRQVLDRSGHCLTRVRVGVR